MHDVTMYIAYIKLIKYIINFAVFITYFSVFINPALLQTLHLFFGIEFMLPIEATSGSETGKI